MLGVRNNAIVFQSFSLNSILILTSYSGFSQNCALCLELRTCQNKSRCQRMLRTFRTGCGPEMTSNREREAANEVLKIFTWEMASISPGAREEIFAIFYDVQ